MSRLTPPAVPPKLSELLKDYPGHIERLQEVLDDFAEPIPRQQPYDEAVWALESALDGFISEANGELLAAEALGDLEQIERANAKVQLMFRARSGNIGLGGRSLKELWQYFHGAEDA